MESGHRSCFFAVIGMQSLGFLVSQSLKALGNAGATPCGKAYHSNEVNFKQLLRTHPFASNA